MRLAWAGGGRAWRSCPSERRPGGWKASASAAAASAAAAGDGSAAGGSPAWASAWGGAQSAWFGPGVSSAAEPRRRSTVPWAEGKSSKASARAPEPNSNTPMRIRQSSCSLSKGRTTAAHASSLRYEGKARVCSRWPSSAIAAVMPDGNLAVGANQRCCSGQRSRSSRRTPGPSKATKPKAMRSFGAALTKASPAAAFGAKVARNDRRLVCCSNTGTSAS
mmetsp:Transcript_73671/g.198526  ORF Transcript_73671/g.198526 Transcript_73671/m.198526 type:complete len:220 (+) Transcript_73671:172-831(+)